MNHPELMGVSKRMLVVDDEPDICGCLQDFFSARGFTVTCAFSGEEALERLAETPVDVMLLDIVLPGIHGIEVLKRARELYPALKVVMVTALDQATRRIEAQRYGAIAYVRKPFDFSEATWEPVLASA